MLKQDKDGYYLYKVLLYSFFLKSILGNDKYCTRELYCLLYNHKVHEHRYAHG